MKRAPEDNKSPDDNALYEEEEEGEELMDDDYIVQLHKYLQEKKRQRIQAEQDANLLDCRLRCLKEQEENTLKKIEVKRKHLKRITEQLCYQRKKRIEGR